MNQLKNSTNFNFILVIEIMNCISNLQINFEKYYNHLNHNKILDHENYMLIENLSFDMEYLGLHNQLE